MWHYTNAVDAAAIRHEGRLRAYPVGVKAALKDKAVLLKPAVWFTVSETPAQTVLAKAIVKGWPLVPGMFWRFGVSEDVAPLTLREWAEKHGYPFTRFRLMAKSAEKIGESWKNWRLTTGDVTADQWSTVEVMTGFKRWATVDKSDNLPAEYSLLSFY